MEHNEQIKALKTALDLEKKNEELGDNLDYLLSLEYESAPNPPKEPILKDIPNAVYNKPKSSMKFLNYLTDKPIRIIISLVLGVIIPLIGLIVPLIYYYSEFSKEKKADVERIKQSEAYKNECKRLDEEVEKQRQAEKARYDEAYIKYEQDLDEYNTVILPKYNNELQAWTNKHNQDIQYCQNQLDETRQSLADHYEATRILPVQYREIDIMEYIYDMISTSDYDIVQATEKYDQKVQRELEMARLQEQKANNDLQRIANAQNAEKNALLEQQNYELQKGRQHNDIANAVNAYQHKKTNDILRGKK